MATIAHSHDHSHNLYSPRKRPGFDWLYPLRQFVDNINIKSARFAHLCCQLIPCCCPFERDVTLFDRTLFHIPSLCKLNPLYDELIGLRFRALSYLSDVCGEDVTRYIC